MKANGNMMRGTRRGARCRGRLGSGPGHGPGSSPGRFRRPLRASLVAFCLCCLLFTPAAYGAPGASGPGQATLLVGQVFTVWGSATEAPEGEFTYLLTLKDATPSPFGDEPQGEAFALKGTTEASIDLAASKEPGIYAYELRCVEHADTHFICDHAVYAITAYVRQNLSPLVVVKNSAGEKVSRAAFAQFYQAPPAGSEVSTSPPSSRVTTPVHGPKLPGSAGGLPKTGDTVGPVFVVGAALLLGAFFILLKRRRRRDQEE